jgi:ketosteroid isomerase-like protein
MVYPGDIPGISGTHKGKAAIRDFYQRDFEQFPDLQITIIHVGVKNLFDLTGNNVLILNWQVEATNRDGYQIKNNGVNVMTVKEARVTHVHTYIFDTGEKFRTAWGAENTGLP